MDIFEAVLAFITGFVFLGFFCVLFNVKFKSFCKVILFNTLNFIVYVLLVNFNILAFSALTCFTFGVVGVIGFVIPVVLTFL